MPTSLREVEALAEHFYGIAPYNGPRQPTTRITLRKPWADGGEFIALIYDRFLPDGSVWPVSHHGTAYRLRVIGADLAKREAA